MDDSRIRYTNSKLDVTFIEIKKEDNLNNSYIEIDEEDSENNDEILKMKYKNKSIYIIHYLENEVFVSYSVLGTLWTPKKLGVPVITHFCNTISGSSGSPILSLQSFKIIGIHRGAFDNGNFGTLMKDAIEEFKKSQINNKNPKVNNKKNNNNFNLNNINNNILNKTDFKNNDDNLNINKSNDVFNYLNEMNIKYLINENDEGINLFGKEFVNNNKENCILTFNDKDYELCDYIKYDDFQINKNESAFEIILKEKKTICNMSNMFHECESLICLSNIDKWDTKNVTNMSNMFRLCSSLCSLPDSLDWNTSQVIDISYMFSGCKNLSEIPDISKWDISNVKYMQGMFKNCKSLKTLKYISNWNTSNIINMSEMFCGCVSLTNLPDILKWETKNVTKMREMFSYCEALSFIPNISNWNTINVSDMYAIFRGCKSLKSLPDISKWNINKCENQKKSLFINCNKELIENYQY